MVIKECDTSMKIIVEARKRTLELSMLMQDAVDMHGRYENSKRQALKRPDGARIDTVSDCGAFTPTKAELVKFIDDMQMTTIEQLLAYKEEYFKLCDSIKTSLEILEKNINKIKKASGAKDD